MSPAYTDTIRQWALDTRRTGTLDHADGVGEVGLRNGEAGKRLAVRFALRVQHGRVAAARFQVFGCGFTIAACAVAADLAEGRLLAEAVAITPAIIAAALGGLPAERAYCANLAGTALQAALSSVGGNRHPVQTTVAAADDHSPRVTTENRVYRLLVDSPAAPGSPPEDRHLFACALAAAAGDPYAPAAALGLTEDELGELLQRYFPAIAPADLAAWPPRPDGAPPAADAGIVDLLPRYLPLAADGRTPPPSLWLARILAARAARPGHLWRAMGLSARSELSTAIRRHLPALADANSQGMRWKRFLYKQVCEQNGGGMCRTPDCGRCSDYALCFAAPEPGMA